HEVEECFFVLKGHLDVFVEDESGKRVTTRLGPWECMACPAGVVHGYQNDSLEPVYFQVMLGRGKPETMVYADEQLYTRQDPHLKARGDRVQSVRAFGEWQAPPQGMIEARRAQRLARRKARSA